MSALAITRDARGALVHVRTTQGECVGCIEVGLYEVLKAILLDEIAASAGEGTRAKAATTEIVASASRGVQS